MHTTSKQVGHAVLHANGRESDLLGSGKKIAALWAAFDELSHDDPGLAKIVLSILATLESREKGKIAGADPRLLDARKISPGS